MKWFLLLILNSFEWCICHLQRITARERFLGDVHYYLEKMFSTFNQPVQFILSNKWRLIISWLSWHQHPFRKDSQDSVCFFGLREPVCLFMISWSVNTSVLKAGKLSLCRDYKWHPCVLCCDRQRAFLTAVFLLTFVIIVWGWRRQDFVCPFYRCRQKLAEFTWFVKGCQARN